MENIQPTGRTALKRLPQRGSYDRSLIYEILDEGFVCHVGFVIDGQPRVIPTGYGRVDDTLYIHGSKASRMLKALGEGIEVCVTVTLLDGLVLARSAFHHSMNYRSVVVFGRTSVIEDPQEKLKALRAFSDHIIPGRWKEVRAPSQNELNMTLVLALPLKEASAKVRTGPPVDDEADLGLPIWAGEIPLRLVAAEAVSAPGLKSETRLPLYLHDYSRPAKNLKQRRKSLSEECGNTR